jgi:hypothetical protein
MYDELSAWARTDFPGFHGLIEKGVKVDGHPAGIQVFLFYWRMIVGDSEAAFKFPFLVMGVLSIWMLFRIGKKWFNNTVGYMVASFVAVIQYMVMYSQIARPYVSGLFFSLMMVWCWSNFLFSEPGKRKNTHVAGFILFAALCSYDHYFSLLFAFIVGVTGLFFLKKENWKQYLVSCAIIILLFIPHVSITIYQLGVGGVGGWLAKPSPHFFIDYWNYIFHFSWLFKGLAIILIVMSFIFYDQPGKEKHRFRLIAAVWFLTPLLIGYFYSVYRNAVLQYSVLIFTFPYLLVILFSFYKNLKPVYNYAIVALILVTGITTLVFTRHHYDLFYRQPVEQLVKNAIQTTHELKGKSIAGSINEPRKYAGYYLQKFDANDTWNYWPEQKLYSTQQQRAYLDTLKADYFMAGNLPGEFMMLVRKKFPYEIKSEKGFTYHFSCFAKTPIDYPAINESVFRDSLNLRKPGKRWEVNAAMIRLDTIEGMPVLTFDTGHEFGLKFAASLDSITNSAHNILNISMKTGDLHTSNQAVMVVSIDEGNKNYLYHEKLITDYADISGVNAEVIYSIGLRDLGFDISGKTLSVYTWNKSKDVFEIRSMTMEIETGNPEIYGLIEKIQ